MKLHSIAFCFVFFLAFLIGCKREEKPTRDFVPISDSLKPYAFKSGSYWIYQIDSTNVEDSIVVTSAEYGQHYFGPPGGGGVDLEHYVVYMYDYSADLEYQHRLEGSEIILTIDTPYGMITTGPILLKVPIGQQWNHAVPFSILDSVNVGNQLFRNVTKMKIIGTTVDGALFAYDSYFYFKDSVGIVKKEIGLPNGNFETWSLKRWNTIL